MNLLNFQWRVPVAAAILTLTTACSPAGEPKKPELSGEAKAHNALMAARASQGLKDVYKIPHTSHAKVHKMLMEERFEDFEALSKKYAEQFAQDPLYESPWVQIYNSIAGGNEELGAKLDKWVAEKPSAVAYAVRGRYKVSRGYFFRGGKFIDETPPENIEKMQALHEEARPDLLRAIEQDPKLLPAYSALIDIEQGSGSAEDAAYFESEAVKHSPAAYYLRHNYLTSLQPRWGGSYEEMQAYVDKLDEAAKINPRIWSLKGEVSAERGRWVWLQEKNTPKRSRTTPKRCPTAIAFTSWSAEAAYMS